MATAPQLVEAATRHQVFLERLKAGDVAKVEPYLREIDAVVRERLSRDPLTEFGRKRLERLLAEVDSLLVAIYTRYLAQVNTDLVDLAVYEAAFEARSLGQVLVSYSAAVPTLASIKAAISLTPMQIAGAGGGKLLASFLKDWATGEVAAVTSAIRLGHSQARTNAQIIQDIRGTKARNYADGILALSQRHASAIVRTSVQQVANAARYTTWQENSDLVLGYQWLATLDGRTSQICRSLDGKVFKLGKGPIPPAHVNCRSTTVAELDPRFKFLEKGATRASKDGQVSADLTYYKWLKGQPPAFQDAAIGKARGKLFRDGGLSAERFAALNLDRNFKPLTLEEMRRLEPLAFDRAGI